MANKLIELKQARQAALDSAGAILSKMETEKRSAMTTEEKAAFDGFHAEAAGIVATMAAIEKQSAVAGTETEQRGGVRTEVHDNAVDRPWGYEARGNESKRERDRRLSYGFGEYLRAVRTAALDKGEKRTDVRLLALNEGFERRAQAAGASEAVPSDGGFLMAPDFSDRILELAHETGLLWPMADEVPISEFTNAVKVPAVDEQSRADGSRYGGVQMFWEQEAQSLVGAKPTFSMLEFVLVKLTGLYYATNELLADTRQLGSIVERFFSKELGFKLDDGMIRGTGAGQLLGILKSNCLVTIAKETGQAAATFNYANVKKMWARAWAPSRMNAKWYINQDVEPQLFGLSQEVGVGGLPVYLPPSGASGAPYGTLFGRPVQPIEQCDTLGQVGDVLLADFSQYMKVQKGGLQAASSMHVQFLTDQMTYRWIFRTNGMPWWKTPLTPFKGTNTLSPFVTLAAR